MRTHDLCLRRCVRDLFTQNSRHFFSIQGQEIANASGLRGHIADAELERGRLNARSISAFGAIAAIAI